MSVAACMWVAGAIVVLRQSAAGQAVGELLILAQSLLLLLLSLPLGAGLSATSRRAIVGRFAAHGIVTALVIATLAAVMAAAGDAALAPRGWWLAVVAVAALVEEAVFRVILPERIQHELNPALPPWACLPIALLLSQSTFALTHLQAPGAGPGDVLRLVVAGGLLYAVVRVANVWAATALHASLNMSAILDPEPFLLGHRDWQLVLLATGLICVLLAFARGSFQKQPLA